VLFIHKNWNKHNHALGWRINITTAGTFRLGTSIHTYNHVLELITMTMHLLPPMYSTTGKKKGKKKFASAEAKNKAEQLDREWRELQKRWGVEAETKKRQRAMSSETLSYTLSAPPGRGNSNHIKSRDTGHVGAISSKQIPQYTGTKIIGIGTMHKSNAVPIFSDEEAVAISTMRR
jgi:hypothetical protein